MSEPNQAAIVTIEDEAESEGGTWEWTAPKWAAAEALALGYSTKYAAKKAGVSDRTVFRWKNHPEFKYQLDGMSLEMGMANRANRMRLANRVIRSRQGLSGKDLLDWLKFAQSEGDNHELAEQLNEALERIAQLEGRLLNGRSA